MTASVDPEVDDLAHTIDQFVYSGGTNGPTIAALAILGRPFIAEALHAAELVQQLRRDHRWEHAPDSTWTKCSCGVLGCRVPDVLDATP